MSLKNIRLEVMKHLEKDVDHLIEKYLIPIDTIWQPTDFLPNSQGDGFF
jgi:acyl-[acyl-carrier-protein] desaturase